MGKVEIHYLSHNADLVPENQPIAQIQEVIDGKLDVAGAWGPLAGYLAELGIRQNVIMTGYVSDEELVWLYRNCYASLYPSLFEGFGLPVLEGMQMGAPTITSTTSSIPEVAGDAAILLDPKDPEAWAHAMLRLSQDQNERNERRAASLKQSGRFEWRRSAEELLGIYEEAMASPKRSVMR